MSVILGSMATRDEAVNQVEQFIGDLVGQFHPEDPSAPGKRGRPRIVPALCLWTGVLVCVLRGLRHQRSLWRLLTAGSLWYYPRFAVSDEAIYRRLARDGIAPLHHLFDQITTLLVERLAPYADAGLAAFAAEVVVLDETTLERLARRLPPLRPLPAGHPRLVGGTVAGLFDVRRQLWRRLEYRENWQQNEKIAAREMIEGLPAGSLILADLGYFSFAWFDELTDAGHFWISRMRSKASCTIIHTFYTQGETFDGLIWLGAYRTDRAKHAVRLVQFRVGPTLYRYITNVRDPRTLTPRTLARLYARRWDFEMAVNTGKTHLGLHLLWSSKPVVIQQQLIAVLIIAQIVQALRFEIAGRAGVDIFEVSLPLLIEYLPQFAARGVDPVEAFLAHARDVGFIRPSTRTIIRAPDVPLDQLALPPPHLILIRTPRDHPRRAHPWPNKPL